MKRLRSPQVAPIFVFLACVFVVAGTQSGPASAALRPTSDIVERFGADPLTLRDAQGNHIWFASGSWEWNSQGTTLTSKGSGMGSFVWLPGSHFTGALNLRFRLGGKQSRARLLFAHDPATGAHRWVEVAAGAPGRITLGQTGSVRDSAEGVIQAWRVNVAAGAWQELAVTISGNKSVTVSLGGKKLFTAAAAPLAPGAVGFGSAGDAVIFDEFAFAADPDAEPCRECHAGQPDQPLAANVYAYWDGRWWDRNKGGLSSVQQGGHGDPGGKPALGCTGAGGCHDMRQPTPAGHRNGFREGRGRQSVNSYHLHPGFIVERSENAWDAQLAFDGFCINQCHKALSIGHFDEATETFDLSHEKDRDPARGVNKLGTRLTVADGEALPLPVDSDITRRATPADPDFVPCISCHDPHGTGSVKSLDGDSNVMLRGNDFSPTDICHLCHL